MRRVMMRLAAVALLLGLLAPGAAAQEATPAAAPASGVTAAPISIPGERIIDLSPDGKSLVALDQSTFKTLCVYAVPSLKQRACGDLGAKKIRIRMDDIVWSPDSTKIAFAENAFQTFIDGDLWVMDAATGAIADLTDDHYQGSFAPFGDAAAKLQGKTVYIDVLPAWSPDSKTIAFSRTTVVNGQLQGNALVAIPAGGGPVTTVAKVSLTEPGVLYWGLAWGPDGKSLYFSYMGVSKDDPQNGIWRVGLSGGAPKRLLASDSKLSAPAIVAVNAAGTTGLVAYPLALGAFAPPRQFYWLLDLATGKPTLVSLPPDASNAAFIEGAAFSPDGTKLLLIVKNGSGSGGLVDQLIVRDLATGADQVLLAAPRLMRATLIDHGLDWSSDGTVLTLTDLGSGLLLHVETALAATPVAAATPAAASPVASPAAAIAPGRTVVTKTAVKLLVSPSADAAVVASLPAGTPLLILADSQTTNGVVFWPVEDPATNVIGWVNAADLSPS